MAIREVPGGVEVVVPNAFVPAYPNTPTLAGGAELSSALGIRIARVSHIGWAIAMLHRYHARGLAPLYGA